jgi:hypothetical protein
MANTRQDLIDTLVQRKLYPKKKQTPPYQLQPELTQKQPQQTPIQPKQPQSIPQPKQPQQQPVQPPVKQPITKMKLPTVPLQKILFLRRTLGI